MSWPRDPGLSATRGAKVASWALHPSDRGPHKSPNNDDEWIDDLGQLYDQMGNPNMIPHWPKQRAQFMNQIDIHLGKTDITVIDLTYFPQHIIDDVNAHLGTLSQQDLDRIIKMGF